MNPKYREEFTSSGRVQREHPIRSIAGLAGCLLASWLATEAWAAPPGGTQTPVLEFLQPTNHAFFLTSDEIPIVLRGFAPTDVFPTAEVLANGESIATVNYCCSFCPCPAPMIGQQTILQIPVPWKDGRPPPRTWQGWTNVEPRTYRLTARAVGQDGTTVEAAPVTITVLDLRLQIFVRPDGTVMLRIPQGSMVTGGFDLEASQDLRKWTRLGPFEPGNVAAFYHEVPPENAREHRFYRWVRVP